MDDSRKNRFDRALTLKNIITSLATGGLMDDTQYRELRSEFLSDPATKKLLPECVRTNLDSNGMWSYLKDYHTGGGAYAARRKHLNKEFAALLDFLTDQGAPADAGVSEVLIRYNAEGVGDAWQKALARRRTDPAGAITAARTLLEEVCKHILDDARIAFEDKWDLPKLYTETAKRLKLAPSQHTEEAFKRILGGCQAIVENLGSLRNKISDAHGGGRQRVRPSERHAMLAVNLSGSMAMFLIETWDERRKATKPRDVETAPSETYKGVVLESRQSLRSEIEDMKGIVDAMTRDSARRLESIWCDSKAGATYTVSVRDGLWLQDLRVALGDAVVKSCGGHNGIYLEGDAPTGSDIDPDWPGDYVQIS